MPSRVPCSIRPSLALLAAALLLACKGDDPPPASDSTSTTDASTSTGVDPSATSGMTTATPTTSVDPDDSTTFGPGCGVDPCPEMCGPECEITSTCIASVWTCECACDTTGTAGDQCSPLEDVILDWVEPSLSPAIHCGTLGPGDDALAWQTAHDCMLIQLSGSGLRATWSLPDGSDPFEYGAAARVGERYEIAWFEGSGTSTLIEYTCEQIVPTPDCVVEVGVMCLTCEGQAEVEVHCEDRA